jgi:flagellar protein FliS
MQKAAYAYLATQVTTTDQGDLLLMLYAGAIKFLKQAKAKIEERDYAQKGMLISKALDVIAELDSSLNAEKGGELAQNLHNLYFYCNTRLLQANLRMNTAQIDEVIRILEALKEAFNQISKSKFPTKAASVHAPGGAGAAGGAPADSGGKAQVFSIGKGAGPAPAAHVLAAAAQAAATAPGYKPNPAARPAPVARPVPTAPAAPSPAPAAALQKPATPAPPAAPAPGDPAPQPAAPENPDLVRVKALHRAYGRYGADR